MLTIGEVARRAGLSTSAIRYYESAGLLPAAARVNGRRRYDGAVLDRLGVIRLAQSAGFTLAETRTLLGGFGRRTPPGVRWRSLAERKRAELQARIEEARAMQRVLDNLLACECPTLDDCGRATPRREAAKT